MHADVAPPAQSGGHAYGRGFPGGLLESARLTSRLGWFVYVAIAVGAALVYWGVAWSEGTLPSRAGVIHLALPTFAFVGLPALAWFNWLARRALSTARPLLTDDPAEQRSLERRLTTMPTRLVVGAGVLGLLALMLLTAFQPGDTYQRLQIFVTPVASVMEAVFQVMTWLGVGIGGVEIARKLWVIDDIYRNRIEISVLRPGPLSAFSRLASGMVIFTLAMVVLGTLALRELASTSLWLIGGGIPTVLAAVAFVAPLWAGHRLMAQERGRNIDALNEHIETTVAQLRAGVDAGQLDQIAPLNAALDGLIAARNEYQAVSTWPWQRSTLGGVITALAAPLAIWVITRVLEGVRIP